LLALEVGQGNRGPGHLAHQLTTNGRIKAKGRVEAVPERPFAGEWEFSIAITIFRNTTVEA